MREFTDNWERIEAASPVPVEQQVDVAFEALQERRPDIVPPDWTRGADMRFREALAKTPVAPPGHRPDTGARLFAPPAPRQPGEETISAPQQRSLLDTYRDYMQNLSPDAQGIEALSWWMPQTKAVAPVVALIPKTQIPKVLARELAKLRPKMSVPTFNTWLTEAKNWLKVAKEVPQSAWDRVQDIKLGKLDMPSEIGHRRGMKQVDLTVDLPQSADVRILLTSSNPHAEVLWHELTHPETVLKLGPARAEVGTLGTRVTRLSDELIRRAADEPQLANAIEFYSTWNHPEENFVVGVLEKWGKAPDPRNPEYLKIVHEVAQEKVKQGRQLLKNLIKVGEERGLLDESEVVAITKLAKGPTVRGFGDKVKKGELVPGTQLRYEGSEMGLHWWTDMQNKGTFVTKSRQMDEVLREQKVQREGFDRVKGKKADVPAASTVKETPTFTPDEKRIATATSRSTGAIGAQAITPRYVARTTEPTERILDFGAGKDAIHAKTLRDSGLDVTAHDFGDNVKHGIHATDALSQQYDTVYASNVLNVQASKDMLRRTLRQIRDTVNENGRAVFNYPVSPRKAQLTVKEVSDIVTDIFGQRPVRVDGTTSAPLWEVRKGGLAKEPTQLVTRPVREFHQKYMDDVAKRTTETLAKVDAYKGWKFEPGMRIRSKQTGKTYEITSKGWDNKSNSPRYFYTGVGKNSAEKGGLIAEKAHDAFTVMRGPH